MPGKIFVDYRRDDVPGDARGVRDALAAKFGKSNVFMDVDNLLVGQRFDVELAKALDTCDVLVAIIGPRWMELLAERSTSGERDYVREEIAAALAKRILVIPVRVGREGSMPALPRGEDLPEDIRELVLHQKHDVAHETFGRDITELVDGIVAVRNSIASSARPGPTRSMPWGWIGLSTAAILAFVYVGAYSMGVPVPWPRSPPTQGIAVAPADEVERLRVAAEMAEENRKRAEAEAAKLRAEAKTRRLAALKVEEDRQKAAAEAKRRDSAESAPIIPTRPTKETTYDQVVQFVELITDYWNRGILQPKLFAQSLVYYGKMVPRSHAVNETDKYFRRWYSREFVVDRDSISVSELGDGSLDVTYGYRFRGARVGHTTRGNGVYYIKLRRSGSSFEIIDIRDDYSAIK